jgi:hypothetical protein
MKIVCIDNTIGNSKHFEIGQIVEARELTEEEKRKCKPNIYYYIIDVKYSKKLELFASIVFNEIWCERRCFITLEEWRETKLNKLLI